MRYMKTCCGTCCTVKAGSQALSIFHLVEHVGTLISATLVAVFFDDILEEARRQKEQQMLDLFAESFTRGKMVFTYEAAIDEQAANLFFGIVVAIAVSAAIGIVVNGLFVFGAFRDRRYFILPHLVFNVVHIVSTLVLAVAIVGQVSKVSLHVVASASVSFAVFFCVQLYFYFVVLSFYKNLEHAELHPQPSIAYTAAPQSDQHGHPLPTHQPQYCPVLPEKGAAV